ncbi:MAG: M14 family zinc carboxypeptidase [bacterium]|nr:M14 family zinc carboxypeptidase [bacterium]
MRRAIVTSIIVGIGLLLFFVFYNSPEPVIPSLEQTGNLKAVHSIIGTSVEGRNIEKYTYLPAQAGGSGGAHIAFVGGIHGGYEWNSVVLAYNFIDYLDQNPEVIPKNLTITVIPSANPDGVYKVIGKEGRFTIKDVSKSVAKALGRFNSNKVDLNRNFDCKWQPKSMWQEKIVSAGTKPFSEPESLAIKRFVLENNLDAIIFWHSQSGAVYASQCESGILPETLKIMNVYSIASGYRAVPSFDSYQTTGDVEGWLAKIGVPAITVELKTHETIEWEENLAGAKALFEYYGNKTINENIGNELDKSDLIRLDNPRPNQVIGSPLIITGEARGYWFFEASFPVFLTNWDGLIIAQGIATAQSDPATSGEVNWMTTEFVPFKATLKFVVDKNAYSNRGFLILRKDNPSGLPENDNALEIPVKIF